MQPLCSAVFFVLCLVVSRSVLAQRGKWGRGGGGVVLWREGHVWPTAHSCSILRSRCPSPAITDRFHTQSHSQTVKFGGLGSKNMTCERGLCGASGFVWHGPAGSVGARLVCVALWLFPTTWWLGGGGGLCFGLGWETFVLVSRGEGVELDLVCMWTFLYFVGGATDVSLWSILLHSSICYSFARVGRL